MTAALPSPNPPGANWWQTFFDDDYAAYGLANDPPEIIERSVNLIIRALELRPGHTVFDQCCGIGRISIPLAQRGIQIIGVDLVESYVRTARQRATEANLPCEFHVGDACNFVSPRPCDAAINWFTSFGYTPDDEHNILTLRRVFESLKPGGRFLMDYLNVPGVMANFRASHVDRPTAPALANVIVIHETRPDFLKGMIDSDWTFLYPDGRRITRRVSTRAYMPHEIVSLLRRCGFEDIHLLGSADGEPFERTSRRCIVLATRP